MKYKVISREQVSKRLNIESYYDIDNANSRRSELIEMYYDVVIVTEDECWLLSNEVSKEPNNEAPYGQD